MKINLTNPNPSLISIIEDPKQIITLDANFLIAPDRSPITRNGMRFEQFKKIWLVFINTYNNLLKLIMNMLFICMMINSFY